MIKKKLTLEDIINTIISEQYHVFENTTLTICCLTLRNGFKVSGESACVSNSEFDKSEGEKWAKENAIEKIWMLEGYLLKQQQFEAEAE